MSLSGNAVVSLKVADLIGDRHNVNTHNETNIAHIRASISRFGFVDPVGVVRHKTKGKYLIVEGHGRYEAAVELGLDEVPAIVLTLSEAERQGYAIAHNQTQQISTMNSTAVAAEFQRLGVDEGDYMSLGFSHEDVLFMPGGGGGDAFASPDGGDYAEGAGPDNNIDVSGKSKDGVKQFIPTVHRSTLRFANDISYNRFVYLVGATLRGRYPLAGSISERIQLLLTDLGMEAPNGG